MSTQNEPKYNKLSRGDRGDDHEIHDFTHLIL